MEDKVQNMLQAVKIISEICRDIPCEICPFDNGTGDSSCGIKNKYPHQQDIIEKITLEVK